MSKGVYEHKPHTEIQKERIGRSVSRLWRVHRKGKTYEEIFGKKLAKQMKAKMSLAKIGMEMPWNKIKPRGKDAPNWKGGTSRASKTGYYSIEYKNWRQRVFKRDGFVCQRCGSKGYITAHHIKSFAHYPKLRYRLSNGLTLCETCHSLTDNYKGRGMRTKEKV